MEIFEYQDLFDKVQMQKVFADGKTFVDCIPKGDLDSIVQAYNQQKVNAAFDLKKFIHLYFELPSVPDTGFTGNQNKPVTEHIASLWPVLTRQPDTKKGSLIPLPHPYIVPGGRFGEIYYWDSYFTMLGLQASGNVEMIENMVSNFSHLVDVIGYIPNGNRTYYTGRSQPPFFSLMVRLLSEEKGKDILIKYLPQLEKEYNFWMKDAEKLDERFIALHHSVKLKGGEILNRYWDENNTPRPESYREDTELSHQSGQPPEILFRHLRAGAESGWDYSSRWFKDGKTFATIHTSEIIPVDLNCLLYHLEQTIALAYHYSHKTKIAAHYKLLAEKRKAAIQHYCWNEKEGYYFDYDFITGNQKHTLTLSGVTPLFFKLATAEQASRVAVLIKEIFLQPGGVVTTLETTGQQWDAPNGWAPLQWLTIIGLENYGFSELANSIAQSWIQLNSTVFKRTGKLMEKYNVIDTHLEAGGGEYDGQDGFGWTNGVLLALIAKYGMPQMK
jgi:alpha,alpha-trehalase